MVGFNGLSIGLSFANTSLILRLLGRSDYGEVVSTTSACLIIVLFTTEWTLQSMVRYGTAEFLDTGRVRVTFWNRLFIAAFCMMLAMLVLLIGFRHLGPVLGLSKPTLIFALAYVPMQMYWLQMQRILPSIGFQRLVYPFMCLERLVLLGTIVTWYWLGLVSIRAVLIGYLMGVLATGVLSTIVVRDRIGLPCRPNRESLRILLAFSWPMIPSVSIGALSTNVIDYIFVRRYVGTAQLGVYSLGVQLSGVFQQLPLIAGTLAMPRIIALRLKGERAELERFIRRGFVRAQWIWVLMCFAGASIMAWKGPKYVPTNYQLLTELVWPLAIVTSIVPIWYVVWNPVLTAFERTRTIMWATTITGVVNVAANVILIPRLGATGSAWATATAFAVTPLIAELLVSRSCSGEIPRRGLRIYLPTLFMAMAGLIGAVILN